MLVVARLGRAPEASEVAAVRIGQPAAALSGATLDGSPLSLADYRGRPVILNFWASWCGPCKDEFPLLKEALAAHEADGLAIVGVLFKDEPSAAATFVASQGADWPTVTDPDGAAATAWKVVAPPQTYFIDRAGVVRERQIGEVRDRTELERLLATILK